MARWLFAAPSYFGRLFPKSGQCGPGPPLRLVCPAKYLAEARARLELHQLVLDIACDSGGDTQVHAGGQQFPQDVPVSDDDVV